MDQHKHTVAHRLFKYNIECGLRVSAIHSDKALQEINPYQSLGPERSIEAMKEIIKVKIPVAVIIMHRMNLEPVKFYTYSEMLKVYMWIREHLNNWLTIVQTDYVRRLPPLEELFALEELTFDLYPHLVYFYGSDFEDKLHVYTPDRFEKLIKLMSRRVDKVAPLPTDTPLITKPFVSIMEKIMELRPRG